MHSRWTVVLQLEWSVLQWTLCGRYFKASGQLYCSLNGVCYSEHYVEGISQQVDSGIAAWMEYVRENIMCELLYSRWTVVLQVEWNVLQWTICGKFSTAGGQCYCSMNGVCYSELYVEFTAQKVDSFIAAWLEYVTVNIMWKLLHSRWIVLLQPDWIMLQWSLCGRYWTACGQYYCSLKGVCYSEYYVEDTSQHVDNVIAAWKECATVNIM